MPLKLDCNVNESSGDKGHLVICRDIEGIRSSCKGSCRGQHVGQVGILVRDLVYVKEAAAWDAARLELFPGVLACSAISQFCTKDMHCMRHVSSWAIGHIKKSKVCLEGT